MEEYVTILNGAMTGMTGLLVDKGEPAKKNPRHIVNLGGIAFRFLPEDYRPATFAEILLLVCKNATVVKFVDNNVVFSNNYELHYMIPGTVIHLINPQGVIIACG